MLVVPVLLSLLPLSFVVVGLFFQLQVQVGQHGTLVVPFLLILSHFFLQLMFLLVLRTGVAHEIDQIFLIFLVGDSDIVVAAVVVGVVVFVFLVDGRQVAHVEVLDAAGRDILVLAQG